MNSYFSPTFFLCFLPLVIALYSVVPKRARWVVLLGASYAFFWCLSGTLIAFIAASTVSVYLCGLWIARLIGNRNAALAASASGHRQIRAAYRRRMRLVLFLGVVLNLAALVTLKYLGFFAGAANSLLSLLGFSASIAVAQFSTPIGISFYTLMAISYLVDVYRESTPADRHLGRVALFLSFFPQIMEGPFCRYEQTAHALTAGEPVKRASLYEGTLRILFGVAKKVIVADRLNPLVKTVFDNYGAYDGGIIALGAIMYTFQLYCDFSGTMDVALGIGRIFNVSLPENFRQPFFSRTASEFWMRWHITLGTWFKDYVYFPVSLSSPNKKLARAARKKLGVRYGGLISGAPALLCVWVGNGLWHGAGSQYLFFGLYYFVMIMGGGFIEPIVQAITKRLGVNRESVPYRVLQIMRTLVIVFVGELFFRANGLQAGLEMFSTMVGNFTLASFTQGSVLALGLNWQDFAVVAVFAALLLVVGVAKERGCAICAEIREKGVVIRWGALIILLMSTVVLGAYGIGYTPVDPMYAQF